MAAPKRVPRVSLSHSRVSSSTVKSSVTVKKPKFEEGQLIDEKFLVCKKINEGGFGSVYKVSPTDKPEETFALKLALTNDVETGQIVKMEIGLLRRLSKQSLCFPRFHHSGEIDGFRYMVMDLLGPSLSDVQLYMPDEKFTVKTVLRVGLQLIDAIEVIHSAYFIHRDIKPGNMAIGHKQPRQIYLFDFGLSRRFVKKNPETDMLEMKEERTKAPFRGTYHYCSLQQHKAKDACRRDDLWAFMYTLIEFISGVLPWEHENEKLDIERMKQETPLSELLKDCPPSFANLLTYLDTLDFLDTPSYSLFRSTFEAELKELDVDEEDLYDWEVHSIEGELNCDTSESGYMTQTRTASTDLSSSYATSEYSTDLSSSCATSESRYTSYGPTDTSSIAGSQTGTSSTRYSSIFTEFTSSSVSTLSN